MTATKTMRAWCEGAFAPTLEAQLEAVEMVRNGIPFNAFISTVQCLGLERKRAVVILGIPQRTESRMKAEKPLSSKQSASLLRLVRIFSSARNTLGSPEKAWRWLEKPNRALDGVVPLKLLDTEVGAQMVADVLGRIEYGVFN